MKTTFLLFVFLFLATSFFEAQNYHPLVDEGKRWSTRHEYFPYATLSDYIEFSGDTLVGSVAWKFAWHYTNEAMTQKYLEGFIREDVVQKKVFFCYYPGVSDEFLLYDFDAAVGDTLFLHQNPFGYVLDSIGTCTLLTGEQRQSFYLRYATYPPCTETWIEGIGSITKGVLNSGLCGAVGDYPTMLCAWENDTMKYHNPAYSYCFVITGTSDLSQPERFVRIFPNPSESEFNVEIAKDQDFPVRFEITCLSGRILAILELVSNKTCICLKKYVLSQGIYLWRAASGNEILATGKLIIL